MIAVPLTERLGALHYRVQTLANPVGLVSRAEAAQAMVVLVDLEGDAQAALQAVELLRASPTTAHIPVLGFARELDDAAQSAARARGATVALPEAALLAHLPQLLERALEI
jgi:CheY-like chemotaxis protein